MGFLDRWRERRIMRSYERFYKRFSYLPEDVQRETAGAIYEDLWNAVREQETWTAGRELGGVSVSFICPYPGHVSFHARRRLDAEIASEGTPIHSYTIEGDEKEGWILTVVAKGTDGESARMAAETFAMSVVLGIPTVSGSYDRVQFSISPKTNQSLEDTAAELCRIVPGVLQGKYFLRQSESDPTKVDIIEYRE